MLFRQGAMVAVLEQLEQRVLLAASAVVAAPVEAVDQTAAISGSVFNDFDRDGVWGAGDNGLEGTRVFIDQNGNGRWDALRKRVFRDGGPFDAGGDAATASASMGVSGILSALTDVHVHVSLSRAQDNNVQLWLVSPDGTRVELCAVPGGDGYSTVAATFDDQATRVIDPTKTSIKGTVRPQESLAAFNGLSANGTWRLEVTGSGAASLGELRGWSLTLYSPELSTFTDANGNYQLTGLAEGNYRVRLSSQAGVRRSSHQVKSYLFPLMAGQVATGLNFARIVASQSAQRGSPIVNIWYGARQSFGPNGNPQQWVNVLGNVSDADGVRSLTYSLNGGGWSKLSIGPDDRRLARKGDFNVEIDRALLRDGANQVAIRAIDSRGRTTNIVVTVNYTSGRTWPTTYTANWANGIEQVAQVVDGLWTVEGNTVRPVETGYDRIIAIGDVAWQDFEFTVPVTIHSYDPLAFDPPNNQPGVGMAVRWLGHSDWDGSQPRYGWTPVGAFLWYDWNEYGKGYESMENISSPAPISQARELDFGVTYMWKGRVETLDDGTSVYSMKIWRQGEEEPQAWDISGEATVFMPNGSLLLVTHFVDASFGPVVITPVGA